MALIYIVEDDEPIRRELVDILARAGFEIEACESFEHVSRDILAAAPDLVFYVAGADPYSGDRLGRLALSRAGLAERDAYVFGLCREHSLPVAVVLGGGYAREVGDVVAIHAETFRRLRAIWFGGPSAGPGGPEKGPRRPAGFATGPSAG